MEKLKKYMETNIWIDRMVGISSDALWPTGFAGAIRGIVLAKDSPPRFIIDVSRVIEILVEDQDMEYQDAWEYYSYNIEGAHMGEHQPVYKE